MPIYNIPSAPSSPSSPSSSFLHMFCMTFMASFVFTVGEVETTKLEPLEDFLVVFATSVELDAEEVVVAESPEVTFEVRAPWR